jgi:hypothetical protein
MQQGPSAGKEGARGFADCTVSFFFGVEIKREGATPAIVYGMGPPPVVAQDFPGVK